MEMKEFYLSIFDKYKDNANELFNDDEVYGSFIKINNFVCDVEKIIQSVKGRREYMVFLYSIKELSNSLFAAISGNYRHAHTSLRLFMELFMAAIYFSAHEIKLRNWLSNESDSDIKWSTISSGEFGIFSSKFIRAFCPDMQSFGEQYRAIACKVYRECSEFVHGNIGTQKFTDANINYDPNILNDWMERVEGVRLCFIFLFFARYIEDVSKEDIVDLVGMIVDDFRHIPAMQGIYQRGV